MRHILHLVIVLCLLAAVVPADGRRRSSAEVRRESTQNRRRMEQAGRDLERNSADVSRTLNRLQSLEGMIAQRADTIEALTASIRRVNMRIDSLSDSIRQLEQTDSTLRSSYASALRTMRSRRQQMSDLAFIFSSSSFGQAWARLRYLRELSRSMISRAAQIRATRARLDTVRVSITAMADSLDRSLVAVRRAQAAIDAERASAAALVKNLRRRGSDLTREIDRRRRQAAALEAELQAAIDAELAEQRRREEEERQRREAEERRRREEERRRREAEEQQRRQAEEQRRQQQQQQSPAPSPAPAASPAPVPPPPPEPAPSAFASEAAELQRLTGSFAANKGRLPFPVVGRYTVVSNFGTNTHPGLSKVKIDNLGIDIEVPAGTSARSVFDGTVSTIFRVDGYNNVVIVRHGEYLTVYAGLDRLNVRKGDRVKTGQTLGTIVVDTGDNDRTVLHFEIRREKQKLNPSEWVR